jgi:Domain of unknown function (DUF1844)
MTDEKKPFTVTDRRHFTPEGESRAEATGREEPKLAEPAPERSEAAQPEAAAQAPGEQGETDEAQHPAFPADFASLLLSLGAQASLLMGIGLAGVVGAPAPDFEGARGVISLLEVLKDKTEGRRTPEEDRILDGILYELRMAYVTRTGAGGA